MIALLSAMQAEIYHTVLKIRQGSGREEVVEWGGRQFTLGTLGGVEVVAGWTGVGTNLAGISCQYVCSRWSPEAILFTGIGGALNPEYVTGDAVLAREVVQWDLDAGLRGISPGVFPGEYRENGEALRSIFPDSGLRKLARRVSSESLREGLFISGNRLIRSGELKKSGNSGINGPDGGDYVQGGHVADMESIGIALAGRLNRIPVMMCRIIADCVDGSKPRDFRKFLDGVSLRLAAFSEEICTAYSREGLPPAEDGEMAEAGGQ